MKSRINFLLGISLLLIATSSYARSRQTWVSGVGDDTNPCSRTAPCKTFAYTISETDPGGEISVLDPGDFGPVTITKSITINGNSIAGITTLVSATSVDCTPPGSLPDSTCDGVVVNAGSTDAVILRGLSIRGIGIGDGPGRSGVQYLAGAKVIIENCDISGFTQSDIEVSQLGPKNLVVKNTSLTGGATGIHLADTTTADTRTQVTNSLIAGNADYGVLAEGEGTISVLNSVLASNRVAVRVGRLAKVQLSNNEIFDNTIGLQRCGRIASALNNRIAGDTPGCSPGASPITVE